jgi:exopolysaccharide biosynthesis polyprenyl glycosylphosphotransferase
MRRRYLQLLIVSGFFIVDACSLIAAFQAAFSTRFHWPAFVAVFPVTKGFPAPEIYRQALLALLPIWLLVFFYVGAYKETFVTAYDEWVRVVKAVLLCSLIAATISFSYRGAEYSRLVIALWCFYSIVFVYALRETAKAILRRLRDRLIGPRKLLIIGKGKMLEAIRQMLSLQPFVKAEYLEDLPEASALETLIRSHHVSEVLLTQGGLPSETVLDTAAACEHVNVPCKIVPDMMELRRGEIVVDGFLGLPTFRIKPLSLHGGDYLLKRGFDIALSSVLLILLFIPMSIIAILIRLDSPGPIFHVQERMGFRLKPFTFYKFRTMVANAHDLIDQLKHLNDRPGPAFKMKNDPRITRVGKWLRRYSLDELPQILNVLKGDMSFVGPRPQVLWEAAYYDDTAKKRLRVKPGITGLWQVSGRAALSFEEMVNLDLYYLENWSLGLDLKILLRTLPAVFADEGAY